ncbi:MAG: HPr kinase/phosphorylase [Bacteroidetes bacterium]|nr:HPr kinase/phosphorylase [Bacteroidota bacterium]MCW5897382.1 HPr kinase/phosphorylase [Bacteroidota bacterium]
MKADKNRETRKKYITVRSFFEANQERFKLRLLNGDDGFDNQINDRNLHRPGLALAGYVELFTFDRVQIIGNTEVNYLKSLPPEKRRSAFSKLLEFKIPCIVLTDNNTLEPEMLDVADRKHVPIFGTSFETTKISYFIADFLDDQFAPQIVLHGSFVDVYGIGVLLIGRSGIGKSEIALDLVERGHRLVADDVVNVTRKGEGILMGSGTDLVKHFMEIRGLGLIDVRSMFGIRAIRFQKRVEIIIELEDWKAGQEYTRTGLDDETVPVLEVEIPHVRLPIFPGKNVTVITEVIALNYLLRHYGYDAAKELAKRLEGTIAEKKKKGNRAINYFEHDFE